MKGEMGVKHQEDTGELELPSGGREFHMQKRWRGYEGRKVQRRRRCRKLNGSSVRETVFTSIIYSLWNAGGETGSFVVHEFPKVDKLCSTARREKFGPTELFQSLWFRHGRVPSLVQHSVEFNFFIYCDRQKRFCRMKEEEQIYKALPQFF